MEFERISNIEWQQPSNPSEPTDPIEPTDPTQPEEPTDPQEETQPSEETQPPEPTEPPAPTEPTEPPPMTSSDDFIEVLKKMEGFHGVAYWESSQWTIGYGTRCPEGKETYYTKDNPMTEEEAVELLRQELLKHETVVNNFAEKYELEFTQNQFDALVSLSYNCGSGWSRNIPSARPRWRENRSPSWTAPLNTFGSCPTVTVWSLS